VTQRIVIALDPERIAPEAIELGHTLACATGARLTLLAVSHWWEATEPSRSQHAAAEQNLTGIREQLEARGNDDVFAHVTSARSVGSALHHAGERPDTGLLVLGPAHREGARRAFAGSTAARFLHGARCPVAIAPAGYRDPERALETVGVAFTDTEDARVALRGAAALARWAGARLRLIGVAELGVPTESLVVTGETVEALLATRRESLRAAMSEAVQDDCEGLECETVVLDGDPVISLAEASADVDLLICGSRAYGPLGAVLLGAVSRPLLHRAACPLLIVPRGAGHRLESLATSGSAVRG
jgi:nucleotide-binding universal stress UspA family protein